MLRRGHVDPLGADHRIGNRLTGSLVDEANGHHRAVTLFCLLLHELELVVLGVGPSDRGRSGQRCADQRRRRRA